MRIATLAFVPLFLSGLLAAVFAPWWSLLLVAAVVGFAVRPRHAGYLFWTGLVAGALVWGIGVLWFGLGPSDLPGRMGRLFGLGSGFTLGLLVVLAGALTAAFGAVWGAYLRVVIQGRPVTRAVQS